MDPKCETLSKDKEDAFHSIVAKLLWIMKRARPDLETAISYLCTRVTKSDTADWGKLRRVIAYIKCTIDDCRIIGTSHLNKKIVGRRILCRASRNEESHRRGGVFRT